METNTKIYNIDATGKRLGKVATEAASLLLGKNDPTFAKHIMADVNVVIENVSKMDVPEKKEGEIYQSYSGYPGGRRDRTIDSPCEATWLQRSSSSNYCWYASK